MGIENKEKISILMRLLVGFSIMLDYIVLRLFQNNLLQVSILLDDKDQVATMHIRDGKDIAFPYHNDCTITHQSILVPDEQLDQ